MKTKSKFLFVFFSCFLISFQAWSSDDNKATKPLANEVVLAFRITITPQIDELFYSHYLEFKTPYLIVKNSANNKSQKSTLFLSINKKNTGFNGDNYKYSGSPNDLCFLKIQIPKDRQITVDLAKVNICGNTLLFLFLPMYFKTTIPDNVNYLYLGTFNYHYSNEYFNIDSFSRTDEFDAAAVQVAKLYGPDAKLYRANLTEIVEENK
jgi:hypothetical protein